MLDSSISRPECSLGVVDETGAIAREGNPTEKTGTNSWIGVYECENANV